VLMPDGSLKYVTLSLTRKEMSRVNLSLWRAVMDTTESKRAEKNCAAVKNLCLRRRD